MSPEGGFPDPSAFCCHCGRLTWAPIIVRSVGSAGVPGRTTLYACPDCFPEFDAGPTPGEMICTG